MSLAANTEVFNEIYQKRKWHYGSGTGSIAVFNQPYITFVNRYLAAHPDITRVVDVGCGDWQIGRHLNLAGREYIGCDVSSYVLEKTRERYESASIQFLHLDAVHDVLPDGDLVIVRDVLQHLSTDDAMAILEKIGKYRYAIVQNDIYDQASQNDDIQNGEFRTIDITEAPFCADGFKRVETYTEGLMIPVNMFRSITARRPLRKGIYLREPAS